MKKRSTAIILCLLFGWLGIHRFYLGETGKGILYIITMGGFFGLIPCVDFIMWILDSNESFDKKYNSQAIQREQINVQKQILEELKKNNS
jgi:TM2 domain-containing membrane protein YozV